MAKNKFDGNWNKVRREYRAFRDAWKVNVVDQKGWTHHYMSFWRVLARTAPVTCATLLGIGGPALALAAVAGWQS